MEKRTIERSNSVGNTRRRENPNMSVDLLHEEERKKYSDYLQERWNRIDPIKRQKAEKQIGEVASVRESARKASQQQPRAIGQERRGVQR